jgi:hypothetical protein
MKILIIENEPKTTAYLKKGLAECGFIVDLASNGEDGFLLALDNTDLRSPVSSATTKTGFDARKTSNRWRVVSLSGFGPNSERPRCAEVLAFHGVRLAPASPDVCTKPSFVTKGRGKNGDSYKRSGVRLNPAGLC